MLALLGTLLCCSALQAETRPNILWLSCEDISSHLGCYGDPHARTPNLDRLASEGVRYSNAFVCAGVCAPCRSTIITGMYQTTLGTQHMRSKARLPEQIKPFTVALREAGYYCTNNSKTDYQFTPPRGTWDESSGKAHWRKRPDAKQPFFSVFNFTECHESGIASDDKYTSVTQGLKRQDPAKLTTLPPYYPDTPATRADWARYYDVIQSMDRRVGQLLKQLNDDGLAEQTIVIFWSDHGVGLPRAKRWLYDSGMRVPMIVRVPAQWKHLLPDSAGSTTERMVSLIDLAPTMLNLAGVAIPSHLQGQAFLGAEQPEPRRYVYGARDRMDERYDIIRAVRDNRFKYLRNYEPTKAYYQYMNTPEKGRLMKEIRRVEKAGNASAEVARFLARSKPSEELYDTQADPHEMQNLADDPQYAEVLKRLRDAHLAWVLESRDLGLLPEAEIAARERHLGSRYAILRQDGSRDLMQRLRQAAADSLLGPDGLAQMLKATRDPDSAVRYWGAQGIGNLGTEAASARGRLVELLEDDSAAVRVSAARALARSGHPEQALPVLTRVLRAGAQWERLQAIIVLDEMDEDARPALAEMQAALKYRNDLEQKGKYVVRVANRAVNDLLGTERQVP